jgi:NADPH-dependent glutamate synthase beta subunit-like oxidoreductase
MQPDKPYAITLDPATSLINKTGSWRTERPVYVSRLPPCNQACPAGENIQAWLTLAEEERYEDAWRKIMEENPLPVVMGRVCYRPCQNSCNRGQLDEAVGINSVERFLGDRALTFGWRIEPGQSSGKRVMIVGAGPAGLSCAYHLRRFGHDVTIYDAAPKPGGLLHYGIPRYRLPREKLVAEIARIEAMGVEIHCNHRIDDITRTMQENRFDAAFIAVGAKMPRRLDLPSDESVPVLSALEVLQHLELQEHVDLHGHVVISGGGNTAVDIGRSAIRLGALKVTVIDRVTREDMLAHPLEIKEALEEGVEILNLRSVARIEQQQVILEKMSATNTRKTRPTGEYETMQADVLVQAVGQLVEQSLFDNLSKVNWKDGHLQVGHDMSTGIDGVYAGGDLIPAGGNVTSAIGHGKSAARHIDAWLQGKTYELPVRSEPAKFEFMETWYYSDAPRSHRPILDVIRRTSGFAEIVGNLDVETAAYEARRCMSCGNCFECDNCYGVCPDNAIKKLGPGKGFEFDYDYCKGCGLCETECPCGAIKMEPETI